VEAGHGSAEERVEPEAPDEGRLWKGLIVAGVAIAAFVKKFFGGKSE
jgi:hypothetical protein